MTDFEQREWDAFEKWHTALDPACTTDKCPSATEEFSAWLARARLGIAEPTDAEVAECARVYKLSDWTEHADMRAALTKFCELRGGK